MTVVVCLTLESARALDAAEGVGAILVIDPARIPHWLRQQGVTADSEFPFVATEPEPNLTQPEPI